MANNGTSEVDLVVSKKNDQGEHECEVLGSGPETMESARAWSRCTKHPGHTQFIPAPEFSLEHLPEEARDESVLKMVKTISARTVRLSVGYTSFQRPARYIFSNHRGCSVVHTGTGYISHVRPEWRQPADGSATSPLQVIYWVRVDTACHVVYDDDEAKNTKVTLFYDDENAEAAGKTRTLWGMHVCNVDQARDKCTLVCATRDEDLFQQLSAYCDPINMPDVPDMAGKWDDLCVIASHPHGQPKKISVGRLEGDPIYEFYYNTATCPGSSGAFVVSLGKPRHLWAAAAHSLGGQGGRPNRSGKVLHMLAFVRLDPPPNIAIGGIGLPQTTSRRLSQ